MAPHSRDKKSPRKATPDGDSRGVPPSPQASAPGGSFGPREPAYGIGTFLLGLIAVVAVGAVLKAAKAVVLPLVIAWLLSYLVWPVVAFLRRRRVPTGLAVTLVLMLLLGFGFLVGLFLNGRVSAFLQVYPKYQSKLAELVSEFGARFHISDEELAKINWGQRLGGYLVRLSGSLFSLLSNVLLVVIFLVFLLLGKSHFPAKIDQAFQPDQAERIQEILRSITAQIGRYLFLQFLISLVTALLVWLALRKLEIDFALTWAALAFILNFIPTIGSIVASIPPILVALVQFYPNYWPAVGTLAAVLTIQQLMGNVVAPKLMGDQLNLSPVVVLLSLLFWGWLWGFAGAVLSVPIASTIKIVCENVEPLRPISIMMGSGRGM